MQIVKQSVARSLPVILILKADGVTPFTGAIFGQMTLSYRKEGATSWSSKTASGNWTEVGKGVYLIDWSITDLNTIGRVDFVAEHADSINYYGSIVVSAKLLDDIDSAIGSLKDPSAATIADAVLEELIADHTSVLGSLADVLDEIHSDHLAKKGHVEWE